MRTHACCWFFCAVALLVCPGAGMAAEGGAEYRAPVSGLKLTPPQARADNANQTAVPGKTVTPSTGNAVSSPPWVGPSGMTTYSGMQAPQGQADGYVGTPGADRMGNAPGASGQAAQQNTPQPGRQSMPAQGSAPYTPTPDSARQSRDVIYGTSQIEGGDTSESGHVSQYSDPETGDIITSVVPPKQPQQDYGTFFIAPQIYPDRRRPSSGSYPGGSAWSGQQTAPPMIMWAPGVQTYPPRSHERHRKERRHADEGYGDSGYGTGRSAPNGHGGGYDRGRLPDGSPYDRRDAGKKHDDEGDRRP